MRWIPKIISLVTLWGATALVIIYVEPELLKDIVLPGSYLPFWLLLSFTLWYTLSIILHGMMKGLLISATIIGGLILSAMGVMHWGLLIVLLLTLAIESWYIYKKR